MGQRSEELANRFDKAVADFAKTIEECTPEQWGAVCGAEVWTVAQLAQHVAGQFPLEIEFIIADAEGRPLPALTWVELNAKNEERAEQNKWATKAGVLKELRSNAAKTSAYVRNLTDEQLDRTAALGLADGAMVSTQQLIEGGVLIAHVTEHLESIRHAQVPSVTR